MAADLYSYTKTVRNGLADRIVPGTIIQFDEFFCYPGRKGILAYGEERQDVSARIKRDRDQFRAGYEAEVAQAEDGRAQMVTRR